MDREQTPVLLSDGSPTGVWLWLTEDGRWLAAQFVDQRMIDAGQCVQVEDFGDFRIGFASPSGSGGSPDNAYAVLAAEQIVKFSEHAGGPAEPGRYMIVGVGINGNPLGLDHLVLIPIVVED